MVTRMVTNGDPSMMHEWYRDNQSASCNKIDCATTNDLPATS